MTSSSQFIMKLGPKTVTGTLHPSNKNAFDWGWQGMLAYGCQSMVVVVDPNSMQVLQTLETHKYPVVKVCWGREDYHHDLNNSYKLRLASADSSGHIVSWDVSGGSITSEFSDGLKQIQDLAWISGFDGCQNLLAAIHPPYSVILWNTETGSKVWKKNYMENLLSFSFDPFDPTHVAFMCQDCVLFVEDFSIMKLPSSNGKKFYISSPGNANANVAAYDKNKGGKSNTITRKVTRMLVGEPARHKAQDEETVVLNDCLQLTYHQACRHHLLLLYPREILILDLQINQTVGIIPIERTGSPFVQVIPCRQRDVLTCLHDNGSITVRIRRQNVKSTSPDTNNGNQEENTSTPLDVIYDLRCQSDAMRVTKNHRVFSMAVCPVTEKRSALIMSDSRLLLWDLKTVEFKEQNNKQSPSPLYTPGYSQRDNFHFQIGTNIPLKNDKPHPKNALADLFTHSTACVVEGQKNPPKHGIVLKFVMTGNLSGLNPNPVGLRMCPPLTTKNWNVYQPLVALGSSGGIIQVYNLSSGQLWREYSIHSSSVRGIEWVSLQSFLSFAFPNAGASGLVKNELILTDMSNGKTTRYRVKRDEESPIEMIKISHLKQYFVVVFKSKPFELWDLRTGHLLREMPRHFPQVTALEWSPSSNLKSLKRRQQQESSAASTGSQLDVSVTGTDASRLEGKPTVPNVSAREHFVFTDSDGLLYHFIVEGNMIKDGSKIPPDGGMGSITCIGWKGDTMVLGDVDGNLNLWDLKSRVSRAIPTHRGWIKKVKFAPGRGNHKLLVLYNEGLDIWDGKEVELVSSLKSPRDIARVIDADWAGSDKPVLMSADGCLRVMDIRLKTSQSPMDDYQYPDEVFSPHLLPPKVSLSLKYTLQHQPWNSEYRLELQDLDPEMIEVQRQVNHQIGIMDPDVKDYFPVCRFGTAERCLLAARIFGDEAETDFWTIALHYLRSEKTDPMSNTMTNANNGSGDLFIPTTPVTKDSNDLLIFDDNRQNEKENTNDLHFFKDRPLDTSYDILCDAFSFQKYQLDRIALHDSKRATYEHTKKCAENLMLLGQTDRAVQLLLETEADNDGYYVDCLRACLVASIRSSGASQSTIKLVATNLIANEKLSEGVQLLCLIDKGFDACRYLQTYGQWYQSAWLAKATLNYQECSEIFKRWVDHLCSPNVNQKNKAVLVLLSLGQFIKVIELLYSMRQFDRATLFIEACFEFGLLEKNDKKSLIEAVFLEYARQMNNLGNLNAAEYYCKLAGEKGELLLKEVQILASDR